MGHAECPGSGAGVRAHLCAGNGGNPPIIYLIWHCVQAPSSCSPPSTGTAAVLTSSKVAFIWPRLRRRRRGLERALERVGVGSGEGWSELWKAPARSRLTGEHLTQERNHIPAEQLWRGPGSSAAARPQHWGCAWPDPPIPSAGTRRAEDGVTLSGRDRRVWGHPAGGAVGMRGSCAQAGEVPCPLVGLNVGTVPMTPPLASLGWLGGSASPHPMALPSRLVPRAPGDPSHPPIHGCSPRLWQECVPMGRACRAP